MSARWLLSALAVVLAVAAALGYIALGTLFYLAQWQLVLHPSRTITAVPSAPFTEIHFDYTATGTARLDGWWIPAAPASRWSGDTVLYLHDQVGSLSNAVADLDALHAIGVNVFALDYRGYGKSAGPHPTEARMNKDADEAWSYLTATRHLNPETIVVYGKGFGASVAAELAARHAVAGVVLDAPNEPAWKTIEADGRSKILPMWLLLHERFDPSEWLRSLRTPKLFLDRDGAKPRTEQLYHLSASPKDYFELKGDSGYEAAVERFLDRVLR
ncbi:MAG TPA: alpha/beta fold hydrolase [Acidobacteriaceae bacterium]|nr:alpha/beta fold hydrolase [Acidobacteriaceae bacterium]